jgi:hypothetical protein
LLPASNLASLQALAHFLELQPGRAHLFLQLTKLSFRSLLTFSKSCQLIAASAPTKPPLLTGGFGLRAFVSRFGHFLLQLLCSLMVLCQASLAVCHSLLKLGQTEAVLLQEAFVAA